MTSRKRKANARDRYDDEDDNICLLRSQFCCSRHKAKKPRIDHSSSSSSTSGANESEESGANQSESGANQSEESQEAKSNFEKKETRIKKKSRRKVMVVSKAKHGRDCVIKTRDAEVHVDAECLGQNSEMLEIILTAEEKKKNAGSTNNNDLVIDLSKTDYSTQHVVILLSALKTTESSFGLTIRNSMVEAIDAKDVNLLNRIIDLTVKAGHLAVEWDLEEALDSIMQGLLAPLGQGLFPVHQMFRVLHTILVDWGFGFSVENFQRQVLSKRAHSPTDAYDDENEIPHSDADKLLKYILTGDSMVLNKYSQWPDELRQALANLH